ncbi:MAG: hypothetical protein PHI35_01290 [Victivallaceae bacterium]|nr:hypothetical protein [Victivallaceae bacterium]
MADYVIPNGSVTTSNGIVLGTGDTLTLTSGGTVTNLRISGGVADVSSGAFFGLYDEVRGISGGVLNLSSGATATTNIGILGGTLNTSDFSMSGKRILDRSGEINISGGTFANANAGGAFGGVIWKASYASGTLTAKDACFKNNTAGDQAGAISIVGGTVITLNTDFSTNKAKNGGAIYNSATLSVTGGSFANNSATAGLGGAIYNSATANISGATFSGNSTTHLGGAIYNFKTMTLGNNTFSGNLAAGGSGGAIYNNTNATLNITGAVNLATATDTLCNAAGATMTIAAGAAVNAAAQIINRGTLTNNGTLTVFSGGVLDVVSGATYKGSLLVSGGVVNISSGANTIGDLNIAGNGQGAANLFAISGNRICDRGAAVNISGGTFNGMNNGGYGAAIWLNGATTNRLTLEKTTFANNTAGDQAGAISIIGGAAATLNTDFSTNKAKNGGAIYNSATLSVTGGTFANNSATAGLGGAIYNSATANISGATFSGNSTTHLGGAIYNFKTMTLGDNTFSGNLAAGGSGGAIYNNTNATLNITGVVNLATATDTLCNAAGATMTIAAGGTLNTAAGVINRGTLSNNGTVNILSGGSVSGIDSVADGAAVNVSGGGFLYLNAGNTVNNF